MSNSSNEVGTSFDVEVVKDSACDRLPREAPREDEAMARHVVVLMLENRSFDNALGYLDAHHPFDGLRTQVAFPESQTKIYILSFTYLEIENN